MNIPLSRVELAAYLERHNAPKHLRADILAGNGTFLHDGHAVHLNVGPAADQAKKDAEFVRQQQRSKSAAPVTRTTAAPTPAAKPAAKVPAKDTRTPMQRAASTLRPPADYREGNE